MKKKEKKKPKRKPKSSKKKRTNKKISPLALGAFIVLAIFVIALILLTLSSLDLLKKPGETTYFPIQDQCSVVLGNLIHQIKDAGDCKIKCINECGIRELDFGKSNFTAQESSCHICDCYCK